MSAVTSRAGLAGTGTLARLAVRRDRVLLPIGILGITLLVVSSAQATLALYPTPESIDGAIGELFANPAAVALYGPAADTTSPDALAVIKTSMMGAIMLAILGYVLVRRHTRTEEEDGRFELVGAGVVGRRAPLAAAVLVATAAVLSTCVLTATGYAALGMDPAGSVASVAGWAATALAFVGITAVAAQVTDTARGCAGLAMGALGGLFLWRAVADARPDLPGWVAWVSPVSWTTKARAFDANQTWVALLGVAALVVGLVVAVALLDRRDLGAGLIPGRRGRAHAGAGLAGVHGLAWRQGRNGVIGWVIGVGVGGLAIGSLAGNLTDTASDSGMMDLLRQLGGGSGLLADVFVATELGFFGIIIAAFAITVILRWRAQETRGYAEPVLATATTRYRYAVSHLLVALAGSAVLMATIGLAIGGADAAGEGALGGLGRVVPAALVHLPAVWVLVGVSVAAVGWLPHLASGINWGALVVSLVLGEFGKLLHLPGWLLNVSPFSHVPTMPIQDFALAPTLWLLATAAAVIGVGLVGYGRRDIG